MSRFVAVLVLICSLLFAPLLLQTTPTARADAPDGCGPLEITLRGSYESPAPDEGAAEIVEYDPDTERLFVVNATEETIDVLDVSDVDNPSLDFQIDVSGAPNSVDVKDGAVAVALAADPKTDLGIVAFYDTDGTFLSEVTAGVLPDMVTFTPDGDSVLVANEGEPNDDYSIDPEGSITLIDVSGGAASVTQGDVTQIGFTDFNVGGPREGELPEGVRIFGPNATVAQDLEPEFIAVAPAGDFAYVTLQENNGLAIIDIAAADIEAILALGTKDHSLAGNELDASNEDSGINIQNWPVFGLFQPDAIAAWDDGNQSYLFTANEGDARDYDGFSEEARVADLTLDPTAFPNAATLQLEENLGRLKITTTLGDEGNDGDYEALYSYGARSFSIWSAADGTLLYDSGSEIADRTAVLVPEWFNSNGTTDSFDSRSDDKGAEPEAVAAGPVAGCPYLFVGLERTGGVLAYSLSDVTQPTFAGYLDNRTPGGTGEDGDLGPEGLILIEGDDSPTGTALVVTANEISNTTTIYEVELGTPTAVTLGDLSGTSSAPTLPLLAGVLLAGVAGIALWRRRR